MHNEKENKVSLLFSGGKDSSLTAFILAKFFKLELITITFGLLRNWKQARDVAKKLEFPFKKIKLDEKIIAEAAKIVVTDGYPANGLKFIHKKVLEEIAKKGFKIIADGLSRDDHTTTLFQTEIGSFEDKFRVNYLQPLKGYSRKTIDLLAKKYFFFKEYKDESFPGAEYEFELREFIKKNYGDQKIKTIFPKYHTHSIVTGIRI
jgi:hypothetical protein